MGMIVITLFIQNIKDLGKKLKKAGKAITKPFKHLDGASVGPKGVHVSTHGGNTHAQTHVKTANLELREPEYQGFGKKLKKKFKKGIFSLVDVSTHGGNTHAHDHVKTANLELREPEYQGFRKSLKKHLKKTFKIGASIGPKGVDVSTHGGNTHAHTHIQAANLELREPEYQGFGKKLKKAVKKVGKAITKPFKHFDGASVGPKGVHVSTHGGNTHAQAHVKTANLELREPEYQGFRKSLKKHLKK